MNGGTVADEHGGDLGGAPAGGRRHTGGLEVDHGHRLHRAQLT
jgi:hypothetical protein